MTGSERLRRLQELFAKALELESCERGPWLLTLTTSDDAAMLAELRRLIEREEGALSIPEGLPADLLTRAISGPTGSPVPVHLAAGDFTLHEVLGSGGMGCVYRGVREVAGVRQEAAIKVLRADLRNSAAVERFLEERRLLARLEHPGIARLLEAGDLADGTPFVAMELVRGQPLLTHCAEKELGIHARVDLFRQVLAAVAHAHRALVVHRDIKPSNVMVDRDGRVRLLDFGIAKGLVENGDLTATGDRPFTPAYAAPEQLSGAPITVACDIYSLGALLYELLSGSAPFCIKGLRAAEIERLILDTPPRPMALALARGRLVDGGEGAGAFQNRWARILRGDLESIVQRSMRKEPEARYASVAALDQDLRNWQVHRPVRAMGRHGFYRLRKFVRRNAVSVAAAGVIASCAAIALALVVQQGVIAQRERDRAREALSVLSDAFIAADPTGISAGSVSARNILDSASRRIAPQVETKPEIYAELAAVIGSVQLALGVVDSGNDSIKRALAWAQGEPGQDLLASRLLLLQARQLVARHEFEEANNLLERVERDSPDGGQVALTRGKYWMARGEPVKAIPFLSKAMGRLSEDISDSDRVDAQWQLAEALRLNGDPAAARSILDNLKSRLTPLLGSDHANVLLTRLRAVDVMLDLGLVEEAIVEAQSLAQRIESIYGHTSSVTALSHSTLALAMVRAERYADSIDPYKEAASAYADSLGGDHITTARSFFNSALMQDYVDPLNTDSSADFRRAINAATHARSGSDPLVTFFRVEFAKSLIGRNDKAAARDVLLPEGVEPDLEAAGPDIAAAYVQQLGELFEEGICEPPPLAPGPNADQMQRAAYLLCRPRAAKANAL